MRLTTRGYVVATVALATVLAVPMLTLDRYGDPANRLPVNAPGIYVCGEGLDGLPGVACFLPDDSPANMGDYRPVN